MTTAPDNVGSELRARYARAIRELLDPADLFLSLTPEADARLANAARELRTSPSRIVSILVGACQDLLQLTISQMFRYSVAMPDSAQVKAFSISGKTEGFARALQAHFLVGQPQHAGSFRFRRHLSVSVETKRLLGLVAAFHNRRVNQIVETLLLLGLPDPNQRID